MRSPRRGPSRPQHFDRRLALTLRIGLVNPVSDDGPMKSDDSRLLDSVQSARRVLAKIGPTSERGDGDFARVSIPTRDGDVLRDWLIAERPRTVIEIGLAYGASALAIGEALLTAGRPDVQHLIVDPFQDQFNDAGWSVLVDAGLGDRCSLERQRSQIVLPRLLASGMVADAAFVDGSHIFHNVFVDLHFLSELVRPGGLVVLDDCDWPSVATAAAYFEANSDWQRIRTDRTTRLRAYRLPDPSHEHRFDEFEPFGLTDHRSSQPI